MSEKCSLFDNKVQDGQNSSSLKSNFRLETIFIIMKVTNEKFWPKSSFAEKSIYCCFLINTIAFTVALANNVGFYIWLRRTHIFLHIFLQIFLHIFFCTLFYTLVYIKRKKYGTSPTVSYTNKLNA